MLLKLYIAWNLAAKCRRALNKRPLQKHKFYVAYAKELISFTDSDVEAAYTRELNLPVIDTELTTPKNVT